MDNCDTCNTPLSREDLVEVRIPRPSDPTDLCCVMAGCVSCFPKGESSRTAAEWNEFIESPEASAKGYLWLT